MPWLRYRCRYNLQFKMVCMLLLVGLLVPAGIPSRKALCPGLKAWTAVLLFLHPMEPCPG